MARIRLPRAAYLREWRANNREAIRAYKKAHKVAPVTLAVDGEGLTREGEHTYNYLAICLDGIAIAAAEKLEGRLSTKECFNALLDAKELYPQSILVGFSLGYDYTHILRDLPNDLLFKLYRPELRKGKKGVIKPIRWSGFLINYLRNRLSITRLTDKHRESCSRDDCRGCVKGQSVTLWDIFGFYQGTFIDACDKWGVVSKAEYESLKRMKENRPTFSEDQWQGIKDYCHLECQKLANLFDRLREAHDEVNLPLRSFFGAGSTATVLLRRMGVKSHLPKKTPIEVEQAAAFAFFGGRFEVSRVGPIKETIYSYDIASAYPYQAYLLPCLACGKWERVTGKKLASSIENARFALVRYSVHGKRDRTLSVSDMVWGPLPFRCQGIAGVGPLDSIIDDGSIVYPASSGGGWTYRDEYLTAAKHWPVKAHEAWIYSTECDHIPFAQLADMYLERLRLGKEGAGIVLKLGINSCYGKLAQTIGKPLYRCPLWAGAITSGCRAQLLELIAQAPRHIMSVATDGLVSTFPLIMPRAVDTHTADKAREYGKVGLGEWEEKIIKGGVMLIRPGIAFALEGSLETKGRGVGKSTLNRHKQAVIESWKQYGPRELDFHHVMFRGAKSSISQSRQGFKRSPEYGQWVDRTTTVSYNPEPKRPYHTQRDGRLSTWAFPQAAVSAVYDRAITPTDVKSIIAYRELQREQPDAPELDDVL